MSQVHYRFEYEVPAGHSVSGRSQWMPFEDNLSGPEARNRFATREDALIVYREHRLDAHEWPVRLIRISHEVVPID
jgi:hypothetical protein